MLPRLVLSMGEPAGIGPDIILALAGQALPAALLAIGDMDCLRARASQLDLTVELREWQADMPLPVHAPGTLRVRHLPLAVPCEAGMLDPANAPAVLGWLDEALALIKQGLMDALVTAPLQKSIINEAGIPFTGHTEYLAERTGTPKVVMLLTGRGLRVALATTHLPLSEVPGALSVAELQQVLRILNASLQRDFGIPVPRILVAGLNPHAGESGHLGREEIELIRPALDALRGEGLQLTGPLPADTLFTPRYLDQHDAVLAMYHDQGLPVLKYHAFGEAVNVTLGLPLVRTSVDHGTALDLAGTGRAEAGSLLAAIELAIDMVAHRRAASA